MLTVFGWLATGLTFIVGAVVSGAIAFDWQRRSWLFDQRMSYAKDGFQKKTELTSFIFGLVSERVYATRNYISALRTKDLIEIRLEREKYRSVVSKWNIEFPPCVVRMKYIFSVNRAYKFDGYFPAEFSKLDAMLGSARKSIEIGNYNIDKILDDASGIVYTINFEAGDFSSQMLLSAEKQKEYIESRPKIAYENIDDLTHTYLLKALFKPRTLC